MKIFNLALQIMLTLGLIFSKPIIANEKSDHNFYVYNTTFEYSAFSEYAIVLNRETKKIKYEKNSNDKAYPASLTKMMTAIVAIEQIEDVEAIAPIDAESYYKLVSKNSSMAGFYINEKATFIDLLYGTLLSSGGEAANSLAVNVAGSVEQFVKIMNDKAKELNMLNTNFTNAEGLDDPDQYTTANDMALLLDYALDNVIFKKIITTLNYQTSETVQHPEGIPLESTVLSRIVDYNNDKFSLIGGKSGSTLGAGFNWAILGIRNDVEYISIVMGSFPEFFDRYDTKHIEDTINMFELIDESND